ncbi:unnamed protein product (macronuclear) [Paramecium tetraurelia]|uniref:FCP1 homology domain-containing protein n=1 Tax=Paramecium tetraurelia TaxID=5888 RepID=A0DBP6_PARTE|nr:uncharacterized protein GSPATT00015360001 [Paramecium tetraurelia]CAK80463.1 unnamed protein product [Paramecium tetraurelia]|eukprot:XP_001447860.1 hypothetical protein (macronuclear) [Paramecium tetraurelia strain d4-2]
MSKKNPKTFIQLIIQRLLRYHVNLRIPSKIQAIIEVKFDQKVDRTPVEKTLNLHQNQESVTKIKQMLNNLVQTDNKSSTSLFGQGLRDKQIQDTKSTRGDNSRNASTSGYVNKNPLNKTTKTNDTFFKQNIPTPQSTRESNQNNGNLSNLYYMFQNKQSDPQIKHNNLTLSQLAKQQQQQQQSQQQKQQRNSNNTTPQKSGNNGNNKNISSTEYLNQIQQLKLKIDNSLLRKPAQKTEKLQKSNNSQLIKSISSQILNKQPQDANQGVKKEVIQERVFQLLLEKEQLWNQMNTSLDNINQNQLNQLCQQIQQSLNSLLDRKNSEYLSKIDMNIIDTFLLESYTILIIALEYLKTQQSFDQNLRNLIVYVTQSNFYTLQSIFNFVPNVILSLISGYLKIKNRYEINLIKETLKQSQANPVKKQFYNKIDSRINELTTQVTQRYILIQDLIQPQKKILHQIAKEIIQDENHNNLNCKKPSKLDVKTNKMLLPKKPLKNYTLVLDLDETLVHYQELPNGGGQFLVRPYAEEFLEKLSKYYELVIFTAAQPDYANFIIDIIDKQKVVTSRLYREHTCYKDNIYLKDLSILGRSLERVIIVDNMPENFQLQPENGIYILSWTGDQNDRALKDLMPLLEQIALKKCKDVRDALNQFREQMIQKVQQGIKNPYQNLSLE